MTEDTATRFSRRNFIKGVVAAGAVASSSAYLFRSTPLHGQPSGPGSVDVFQHLAQARSRPTWPGADAAPARRLTGGLRRGVGRPHDRGQANG